METTQFQETLQKSREALQNCQKQNNLQSCLSCPQVLKCAIRSEYVRNVYLSLNQGQNESDFDF